MEWATSCRASSPACCGRWSARPLRLVSARCCARSRPWRWRFAPRGQLPDKRRAESRQDPPVAKPRTQPLGLFHDRTLAITTDVFEEAQDELAVWALGPATCAPAVPPDRRSRVAGTVEHRGPVRPEVPVPPRPALP